MQPQRPCTDKVKLPIVVHETVTKSKLKPGRLIIVGDVHGCAAELQQLLQQVQYTQEQDNLIFVGDLVNKGPRSIEVGRPTQGATQGADCSRQQGEHGRT